MYRRAERLPFGIGRALFSRALQVAAPYFLSIPASIESAEPGRATARMRHLPWVRNHLGSVHAIALCNLAEMTMGVVAEATVPATHRWIPKGMTVNYTAIARGTMHAEALLDLPELGDDGVEVPVRIGVTDDAGTPVFDAEIRIWITPR
jgi:acyl-coenzyme A thioesterase PaaI-like protein